MTTRDSITLFPDTNIFLHYQSIKEVKWCSLLNVSSVKIVVCLEVIKELDDKKTHPLLNDRAKKSIDLLRVNRNTQIADNVHLSIFTEPFTKDDITDFHILQSSDDRIIQYVKKYFTIHPDETVAVLGHDYGMELRCEAENIRFINTNGIERLPDPKDAYIKENHELRNKLLKNEYRRPDLSLYAITDNYIQYESALLMEVDKDRKELSFIFSQNKNRMDKCRYDEVHSLIGSKKQALYDNITISFIEHMNKRSKLTPYQQIDRYNVLLDNYYKSVELYINNFDIIRDVINRSFFFEIWINNYGNATADNATLFIYIPESIKLRLSPDNYVDHLLTLQEEPFIYDGIEDDKYLTEPPPSYLSYELSEHFIELSKPLEKQEKNITPHVNNLGNIQHHTNKRLYYAIATFRSWDVVKTFSLKYIIVADNNTEPFESQIVVNARIVE